ncbi:MAG: hypothetical protein KCHDKBKB_02649 [Elusimicrobia bacterium]|nr:hypothetical protein [Elusimicrobiota bacterium]
MRPLTQSQGCSLKVKPRSLFGSHRPRHFREPKARSHSYKRKQRVRFRPRYASSVVREWSKTFVTLGITILLLVGGWGGGKRIAEFWRISPLLKVQRVDFKGDIPLDLQSHFPIRAGDHLFTIKPRLIENEMLVQYPELESFSVYRIPTRQIKVSGKYRTPVALTPDGLALDQHGQNFPLRYFPPLPEALPTVHASSGEERKDLLNYLSLWKNKTPHFYALIKKLETDRMRELIVELSDGITIDWGPGIESELNIRAEKVLRVREMFKYTAPAKLTFITSDRIVMDKNWKKE